MKKILITLSIFLLICYLVYPPQQSFAQNNFQSSYDVTYTVSDSGITHADFAVSLKNTASDYYISAYSLQVGFANIQNVTASEDIGSITPDVKKNTNGYLLSLHFNKKVVGIDKVLQFNFSFDTPDVAQKLGKVWEINVPGVAHQEAFENFSVHIHPSSSFGKPTVVKPPLINDKLDFTKEQLGSAGISVIFGTNQVYDFHLTYHLENKNLFPIKSTIALPPQTNYQDIAIQKISPSPINVLTDQDNNWIASYLLYPSQKIDVTVTGRAVLTLIPKEEKLSNKDLSVYLQSQPYWQTHDTTILQVAHKLQTPQKIYEYVRTKLSYDFSRVSIDQKRLGGAYVLQHPQLAVCLEFTDLFIALARANGIPARELEGYAYTQNVKERPLSLLHDILHAWPEYFDTNKNTWIMVDPTWGNTTGGEDYFHVLDYNHVVFAINGYNSSYPIPAGGYKFSGQENQKDVQVTFAKDSSFPDPKIGITDNITAETLAGLPILSTVTISNAGEVVVPKQQMIITGTGILHTKQTVTIPPIPPYGHIDVPISFKLTNPLTNTHALITIQVGSSSFSKAIAIVPFYLKKDVLIGGGIFVILCIVLLIIATRSRRV